VRALRLVPLDALTGFQRRWPVRAIWGASLVGISHLVLFTWVWYRAGLDAALFATGAMAGGLLVLNEVLRDRGKLMAKRVFLIAASEFKLETTEPIRRELGRHGPAGARRQMVTQKKDIPPSAKVNNRPLCHIHYLSSRSRWTSPRPEDIRCIDLNYAGTAWPEHDRKAVKQLRVRLESRLGITLRAEQTTDMLREDWIRLWQADPVPEHVDVTDMPHIPGRMVVAFAAPHDATSQHVRRIEREDGTTHFVVTIDPRKVPHMRVHGRTGKGKTVTLDDLISAFLTYASTHGEGMGRVIAADCKMSGSFVKWKNTGQVILPRSEQQTVDLVAELQRLMNARAAKLDVEADAIIDAWDSGAAEVPLVPTFEPTLLVVDEFMSLMRWLANQDRMSQPRGNSADAFSADLADLVQKGRAVDIHVCIASQWANVDGAGGAKLPSDIRGQMELVVHMGSTSPEQGKVVYGTKDGAEWAEQVPDTPGMAGIAIGTDFFVGKMPLTYDPVAHGTRHARVDASTRLDDWLTRNDRGAQQPDPEPEPDAEPGAPTVELFRLDMGTDGPVVDAEREDDDE
jgi:hypothetical protein